MTPSFLMLDLETRSDYSLRVQGRKSGTSYRRYASAPNTGVICVGLQMHGSAARTQTPATLIHGKTVFTREDECPAEVLFAIEKGIPVYAHNALFDRTVWRYHCHAKLGWPDIPDSLWRCTMAIAAWQNWPKSLESLAIAAGLENQKDMSGNHVMHQCALPRKPSEKQKEEWAAANGNTPMPVQWWEDTGRLSRVYEYCRKDVETQTEFLLKAGPLPANMQEDFDIDYRINDRGVRVDFAELLLFNETIDREMEAVNERVRQLTASPAYPHGFVPKITARGRIVEWLYANGVSTASLDKPSVQHLLGPQGVANSLPAVRELLELKRDAGLTSLAKVPVMINLIDNDERLRHSTQWHGASTGRLAGRGWQPQNLPRDVPKEAEAEELHATLKAGRRLADRPLQKISNAIRTLLLPSPGNKLLVSDFNAIECRVVAWLAGCELLLRVFLEKRCPYRQFAARIFGVAEDSIAKTAPERQLGKVAVLALGYGMGGTSRGGQPSKFQSTAKLPPYNWDLDNERSESIVKLFRSTYSEIPQLWRTYESAWVRAVTTGTPVYAGACVFYFDKSKNALVIQLPSGRLLWYQRAGVTDATHRGRQSKECYYWAEDSVTHQWVCCDTWGGTLAENITQAVACDLLKAAIHRCEKAGYDVVLSVHDEVVADSPLPVDQFHSLMEQTPEWATGLPVACETKAMARYGK